MHAAILMVRLTGEFEESESTSRKVEAGGVAEVSQHPENKNHRGGFGSILELVTCGTCCSEDKRQDRHGEKTHWI